MLGGSFKGLYRIWGLGSRRSYKWGRSRVSIFRTHISGLITPLITTHEPPSTDEITGPGHNAGVCVCVRACVCVCILSHTIPYYTILFDTILYYIITMYSLVQSYYTI